MKRGDESLEDDLNELNECSDYENEYDGLEIFDLEGNENEIVDRPARRS